MKFCQYVDSSYLHILANFGRFNLIFNKMALIFLRVPIVVNVLIYKFHPVESPYNFIANNEWSPVHPTSIHWIIRLVGNAGVLLQAATEAKIKSQVYRCTLADLVCLAGESH